VIHPSLARKRTGDAEIGWRPTPEKKKKKKKKPCADRLFPKMGECREVLGGGPAPPSKL
jgi:hypothetical protein